MRERVGQLNSLLGRPNCTEDRNGGINIGSLSLYSSGMSDSTPSLPLWSVRMYIDKAGNSRPLDWLDDVTHGELMERTAALMDHPAILGEKAQFAGLEPELYPLTGRQHATVMAALRLYERNDLCKAENRALWLNEIATDDGQFEALNQEEIVDLIDILNAHAE